MLGNQWFLQNHYIMLMVIWAGLNVDVIFSILLTAPAIYLEQKLFIVKVEGRAITIQFAILDGGVDHGYCADR